MHGGLGERRVPQNVVEMLMSVDDPAHRPTGCDPADVVVDLGAGADAAWASYVTVTTAGPHLLAPATALIEGRLADIFATADRIRRELAAQGVELKDSAQGTTWVRA